MKRVLAFCFFPAFAPPSNGGESRVFNFYHALSAWHHVTLLTSGHVGVAEERVIHGASFIERRIPKDEWFLEAWSALEPHSGGGDLSGPCVAASAVYPTTLHDAYLEEYEAADLIIHDFPFTIGYDVFAGVDLKCRVYNAHNCETDLYRELHPSRTCNRVHNLVAQAEEAMLQAADLVLFCNEYDLIRFKEIAPQSRFSSRYAPNGTNLSIGHGDVVRSLSPLSIVFLGSGHPPNVEAARMIAERIAPAFPHFRFDFIGSCLPAGSYQNNVVSHGVVDDQTKSAVLRGATLALNPMRAGSGSNVKVLDYFAHAVPVLSSSFGMRGILAQPGEAYLEAPVEDFVEAIREHTNDLEHLRVIGECGLALARQNYSWESIAGSVAGLLNNLCRVGPVHNNEKFIVALNDYDSFNSIGGGATRTRGLYVAAASWSTVVFLCFSADEKLNVRRSVQHERIWIVSVPRTVEHAEEVAHYSNLSHISVDDIVASRHCVTNPLFVRLYEALRPNARCVVVEHSYLAPLPASFGDRFVYSSQNNESALKEDLLRFHPARDELLRVVRSAERLAVERAAAVITVSHADALGLARQKRTGGPFMVVPNGSEPQLADNSAEQSGAVEDVEISTRSVVFLGSAHMPNVEAVNLINRKIAPACPDVTFHIIGSVCESIDANVSDNMRLWGVLPGKTKRAVMEACALALNPMTEGSGSNVKLADYLGTGLYVISTEFGQRGYAADARAHVRSATIEEFPAAISEALATPELYSLSARQQRAAQFGESLSMVGLAERFVDLLKDLEQPKRRVLFVTYRYTAPSLGGAEVLAERVIDALGRHGGFSVDVISPEVTSMENRWRFTERYFYDADYSVPVDVPNVRFARFAMSAPDEDGLFRQVELAWRAQNRMERVLSDALQSTYANPGLTWGWASPDTATSACSRWAMASAGLFVANPSVVQLAGKTLHSAFIRVLQGGSLLLAHQVDAGDFNLSFEASVGIVEIQTSIASPTGFDPRPLGFLVGHIVINGDELQIQSRTLIEAGLEALPSAAIFDLLHDAAQSSRAELNVRLAEMRGPWSDDLERYLADHIAEYDLVITQNYVFRPAIAAITQARKQDVPVVLWPHAHLDDDFYHFPDLLEAVRDADLVLASPLAACDFFHRHGGNVRYLSPGIDGKEHFSAEDEEAFRRHYPFTTPFVLVLGRKSAAKNYQLAVDAVASLAAGGERLRVVLIGPDDDGVNIDSPHATYLGRQPREVVRGALRACFALVNMSTSESFGMVLLEAWMAGKPVVANRHCAAFADIAVDNENALLVDQDTLADALQTLLYSPQLAAKLGENGRACVALHDWQHVSQQFLALCEELLARTSETKGVDAPARSIDLEKGRSISENKRAHGDLPATGGGTP
jgi:glycosyltransferase involved in cell wall biosynthesis